MIQELRLELAETRQRMAQSSSADGSKKTEPLSPTYDILKDKARSSRDGQRAGC